MRYKRDFKLINKAFVLSQMILLIMVQTSCKKYLEKKPKQDLAVPSTLSDLQAILDNETYNGNSPGDLEFVADNYYLTNASWNNSQIAYRNSYIWDRDATITNDDIWLQAYYAIYESNFVLDQLPKIKTIESQKSEYNNIKGTALFYRSFMFYQLAQLFCKPYSSSANTDPGIILRLTAAVETPSIRPTVQETYDQITSDLKIAASLLPNKNLFLTRPNKSAAYGMLARIYLSMQDYTTAGKYADSVLMRDSVLLDFNTLIPSANSPLPYFTNNPEILYVSWEGQAPRLNRTHEQLIDTLLYQSYDSKDLRKTVYFGANTTPSGTYYWQGSYYNNSLSVHIFDGLAIDEIYLIRAECKAKTGFKNEAMNDLNKLLRKRWKNGTFSDLTATDDLDALNKIRAERRKELVFRGLRWTDLRRFNLEGANITLKRIINGTNYTLPPNDLRWVLLIPQLEINRTGITQNPR